MAAKLFTLVASTLAILASTASAAPNKPRLCGQVDAPDFMVSLQRFPDPHAAGSPGTNFYASQTSTPAGALSSSFSQVVGFNGPVGAYGCQISLTFPEDIAKFYAATGLDGKANPPTMNVYRINFPVDPNTATYSDLVKKAGLFGTATVRPGPQVINSATCPTAAEGGMAFLFEIPEWIHQSTQAAWTNSINSWDIFNSVGVFVNYNC
jgi:hypothetical protein